MATYNFWCGTGGAVANQTATFGAATIAGAGGFKPINASGATRDLSTYNSLVSGSLGAYTPSISGGKLVFSGAAGAPNGAVLRCGLAAGGTVDITIATSADTYSASTVAEIQAACSAIGSAGGKTVLVRRGTYDTSPLGSVGFGNGVTYSSEVVILGEGTATSGYGARFEPCIYINNISKVRYSNLEAYSATGYPAPVYIDNACVDLVIEDCWAHGKYYDPAQTWDVGSGYANTQAGIYENGSSPTNLILRRNLIEDVYYGISILHGIAGTVDIDLNEIRHFTGDAINFSASDTTATKNLSRNVIYSPIAGDSSDHSDAVQIGAIGFSSSTQFTNWTIRQNVIFNTPLVSTGGMQGLFSGTWNDGIPGNGNDDGYMFKSSKIAGNIYAGYNQNAIDFVNVTDGYCGYNTVVWQDTDSGAASPTAIELGLAISSGTVLVKHNAADAFTLTGGATFTQANNVTLGTAGATVAYSAAFDWADPAVSASTYAQLLVNLAPKSGGSLDTNNAGAIGTGYCTFGSPRNATGWSYDTGLEV